MNYPARIPIEDVARFLEFYELISRVFSSVGSFAQGLQISKSELLVLEFVSTHEGTTMTKLAAHLGVRLTTATGIVDRLAARKFVERVRNHGDRRIVRLSLTVQGRHIVSTHRRQMRAAIGRMMSMLSSEERQTLLAILQKVATQMAAQAGGTP